jgi:hypothetical protein
MKPRHLIILLVSAILTAQSVLAQPIQGKSFFLPRSQGTNAALDISGVHPLLHRFNQKSSYGVVAASPFVAKSVRANRIAEAFFGTDVLTISGSQVSNRGEQDFLADYFGLSPAFASTVFVDPSITSFQVAFNGYYHFDKWVPGLYTYLKFPVVYTKWDLNLSEEITDNGITVPYPPNYMDENAVYAPATSFIQALTGHQVFGDLAEPLEFSKVCGSQSKKGIADFQWIVGYDFILREHGHVGVNLRMIAPTGSKPDAEFMFEAIVGNGKHWGFGGGFDGHVLLWESNGDREFTMWTSATLSHLFKSKQQRTFDLQCDRFGSRFILLKEFDANKNYTGRMFPGPNILSLQAHVSVSIEFEFLLMFAYTHNGFVFDIGYNGWLRGNERICLAEGLPSNTYALKGIQNVSVAPALLSNATQSNATLFGNPFADQAVVADPNPPLFISTAIIDTSSAESPLAITHKIFTHIGYIWDKEICSPFVGIGGQIEFEGINTRETRQPLKPNLSQWGIWLRGGTGF